MSGGAPGWLYLLYPVVSWRWAVFRRGLLCQRVNVFFCRRVLFLCSDADVDSDTRPQARYQCADETTTILTRLPLRAPTTANHLEYVADVTTIFTKPLHRIHACGGLLQQRPRRWCMQRCLAGLM